MKKFNKILPFLFILFFITSMIYYLISTITKDLSEQSKWVVHTHLVIEETKTFLGALTDAETGQRGFLLTLDNDYLVPYHMGVENAKNSFKKLKKLTSDNELQQQELIVIKEQMNLKLEELLLTINLTKSDNKEKALEVVKNNSGKEFMSNIRDLIDEFIEVEKGLLEKRNDKLASESKKSIIIILTIMFIFTIGILVFMYIITLQRTKLKNINNTLEETNNKLKKAHEIARISTWNIDLKNKSFECSDELFNIFDISKDKFDFTYENFLNLIYPDDRKLFSKSLENEKEFELIYRLLSTNGETKWTSTKWITKFDEKSNTTKLYGTMQDITKEKQYSEQLKQKDLQLFEQAKLVSMGEMISNIAHQWRQPLNAISVCTSGMYLKSELNDLNKDDILEFKDTIMRNTSFLSDTIDTFRNFLKKDNVLSELVISDEVKKAIDITINSLNAKGIKLEYSVAFDEELKVLLKENELVQVILNLINNAKDAIKEKDIISGLIKINLFIKDELLTITVEDNAGGIPEEILDKVFEPYFTTKNQTFGTGLGLHMSYRIVTESMNGKFFVKNTDIGAKFYIQIPIK